MKMIPSLLRLSDSGRCAGYNSTVPSTRSLSSERNGHKMKIPPTLLILSALMFAFCAAGQVAFPNKMSSTEAAKIAGQLSPGMAEREVSSFLETNGLRWSYTAEVRPEVKIFPPNMSLEEIEKSIRANVETNASREAFCLYPLDNHCVLRLHVSPEPGVSTNRVLRSALIESNGVQIKAITLKTRP